MLGLYGFMLACAPKCGTAVARGVACVDVCLVRDCVCIVLCVHEFVCVCG